MDVTDDISLELKPELESLTMAENVPSTADLKIDQTPTPSLEPPLRDSAPSTNSILGSPSKMRPTSVIATKNTRKRMEDRHVVLHDLKAYLPSALQAKVDSEEHVSYYAVFDGHAGTDAAAFAAAHLHEMLIASPAYPADPVAAFSEAFIKCDSDFINKSKKSGSTAICSLIKGNIIFTAWLGDSQAVLVRNGVSVKIVEAHKPNRDDERARIEALGGSIMHWGTWRVNGQLAVSRAIGDGEYKPYISAEADITTVIKNGSEDFLIVACDGLWDTITPEEATEIVFQHLEENRNSGGDIENIGARLATASKDRGSGDNITIIVVFIRPVEELIARGRGGTSAEQSPDIEGVSSTSDYVFMTSRESLEPSKDKPDFVSPNVSFGNLEGGAVFSPDPFGNIQSPGAGFNFSSENFDNKIEDKRLSEDSFSAQHMEEILKQQSIAKVEDLFKMLDREDCSPTPEEEDARPLEEILAAARLQPQDEVDGVVDDDDSSDDEIVDFGACDTLNSGSGNPQLEEILKLDDRTLSEEQEETDTFSEVEVGLKTFQEPRMDPCEQVTVKETGPQEYSTIVPPVQEMPSQEQPVMEVVDPMVCSVVREEQEQDGHDVKTNGVNGIEVNGEAGSVSFDANEDVGFMLKTPGETGEERLAEFTPEKETSVDTGESVEVSLLIPNVKVTPATPIKEMSPAPIEKKNNPEVKEASEKSKPEAKDSNSKSSAGAKPKAVSRESVVKQVKPTAKTGPTPKPAVKSTPTARSAPSAKTATAPRTAPTTRSAPVVRSATAPRPAPTSRTTTSAPTSRSKVLDENKSNKSGSTTGSEKNSKSGTTDRQIQKTAATRTLEKKDVGAPKPTMTKTRDNVNKDATKEPRTVASRRPISATTKTSSNVSGQTSSASSQASSTRSRPGLSRPTASSRPATTPSTVRMKPDESLKKVGPGSKAPTASTTSGRSSASATARTTSGRSSASATASRAAKTTAPVKPSAAAERVAAARAAAMAKPATKIKTRQAGVSKKQEEKNEDVKLETNTENGHADPVPVNVNTNGKDTEKEESVGTVNTGEESKKYGDIEPTVNGLSDVTKSDVNQSEC